MFILCFTFDAYQFWSVNYASICDNSELNAFRKKNFIGKSFDNGSNDLSERFWTINLSLKKIVISWYYFSNYELRQIFIIFILSYDFFTFFECLTTPGNFKSDSTINFVHQPCIVYIVTSTMHFVHQCIIRDLTCQYRWIGDSFFMFLWDIQNILEHSKQNTTKFFVPCWS